MIRSKFVVIASVLMLLFVTGCNQEEAVEENPTPTPVAVKKKAKKTAAGAKAKEGETADKTATAPAKAGKPKPKAAAPANNAGAKQTLAKLNGYLPAAVKALETDDVDTAKLYVKGFSDNWQQQGIQSSVKKGSQDSFKKISAGVTQVNNLMKAEAPDKAKAKAAIQSLSSAVLEYAK